MFKLEEEQILLLANVKHNEYKNDIPFDYYTVGENQGRFLISQGKVSPFGEQKYLSSYNSVPVTEFNQMLKRPLK